MRKILAAMLPLLVAMLACNLFPNAPEDFDLGFSDTYPEAYKYSDDFFTCMEASDETDPDATDAENYRYCLDSVTSDPEIREKVDALVKCLAPAVQEENQLKMQNCYADFGELGDSEDEASGTSEDEPDSPIGTLTLQSHEAYVKSCTSTTDGDYYVLDCIFTITANLSYEISRTPAYATCRAYTLTNGDVNSVELIDLQDEIKLSVDIPGVMRQFKNGEGPVEKVDGYYANLTCTLSEFEGVETGGLDSFHCKHPDVAEKDCDGPWMDFSGSSP